MKDYLFFYVALAFILVYVKDKLSTLVLIMLILQIKPIPLPAGEVASTSNPQCFYVPSEDPPMVEKPKTPQTSPRAPLQVTPPAPSTSSRLSAGSGSAKKGDTMTKCDVCNGVGSNANLVR